MQLLVYDYVHHRGHISKDEVIRAAINLCCVGQSFVLAGLSTLGDFTFWLSPWLSLLAEPNA